MIEEHGGPRGLAEACAGRLVELSEDLKRATDRAARASIKNRIRSCRALERWAKTRAGYRQRRLPG